MGVVAGTFKIPNIRVYRHIGIPTKPPIHWGWFRPVFKKLKNSLWRISDSTAWPESLHRNTDERFLTDDQNGKTLHKWAEGPDFTYLCTSHILADISDFKFIADRRISFQTSQVSKLFNWPSIPKIPHAYHHPFIMINIETTFKNIKKKKHTAPQNKKYHVIFLKLFINFVSIY